MVSSSVLVTEHLQHEFFDARAPEHVERTGSIKPLYRPLIARACLVRLAWLELV